MPHSLRAQLSTLRYKGLLKDSEYERLRYALDAVEGRIKPYKCICSKRKGENMELSFNSILKQFVKERDEAARSYDVDTFKAFVDKWKKLGIYNYDLNAPTVVLEVVMRKMVYHATSSTKQEKAEARLWLLEHGCTTDI